MQLGLNCVTAKSFVENAPRATRVQRFAIVAVMHNRTSVVFEQKTKRVWRALGLVSYGPTEVEKKSLQYRRSLYVVQDLNVGEALTRKNVRAIRPGLGLPPKHLDQVLGMKARNDTKRGTALGWELLCT